MSGEGGGGGGKGAHQKCLKSEGLEMLSPTFYARYFLIISSEISSISDISGTTASS